MTIKDDVLSYSASAGDFTAGDAAEALSANPNSVRSVVWDLVGEGRIVKVGARHGYKGRPQYLYSQRCVLESTPRRSFWSGAKSFFGGK